MHYLYWIHRKEHDDPLSQGYIGISNNPERRLKEHSSSKFTKVGKIINNSRCVELTVIKESTTLSEILNLELSYRPEPEIGWNQAQGGGLPPSNLGLKRPAQSLLMTGDKNPAKRESTRKKISQKLKGRVSPTKGSSRPEHSIIMSSKVGESYPKFKGWYVVPHGRFASYKEAVELSPQKISIGSLYNWCVKRNDKEMTRLSYLKSLYLQEHFSQELVGMTYKELGFDFDPK